MLREISIQNFAIIDEITLSLGNGLNIITGETGAGKSIILDALSLVLGDRSSADLVRSSADEAHLEAVFELDPMPSAPAPEEELLQAFARRLRPRLRDLDAVARVGHRRFAVLNPHTDRSGGRVVLRARETLVEIAMA